MGKKKTLNKRNKYETKWINIVERRWKETYYLWAPVMFRVSTHTHTQTRTINIYILLPYIMQLQTILQSPIVVHFRFSISEFPPENYVLCLTPKLTSWKLQLLWTMVNITQNQKKKTNKRTRPSPMGLMSTHTYIYICIWLWVRLDSVQICDWIKSFYWFAACCN